MAKPLVLVTTDYKQVDPYMWHAVPSPYIDAVANVSGALPLALPSLADRLDIDDALDRADGVLVTGSRSNVHPSHYGVIPTEDHEPFDPARDATTLPLIRRAIERGVPLLAICRGIQELNVALGGSITAAFQKNRNIEGHGYPWEGTMDERFALAHSVKVAAGSCLEGILQGAPPQVNSLHTQALDELGRNIVVEAMAADGTIEAVTVESAPGWVVGVQWHPEYWAATDTASNKVLAAFGDASRAYMHSKTGAASVAA
ncbi:gamma-glutamyl-gamma-aminobutyrate hydrolase family protein [Ahrensia sp. R2A130]|uniref:gamma-glutamyl-gamma-aminobutyrate hydrolase family protein n=1 Tax=Ahrensia sp. R2A130 TaxID=744979 RepID=UPI00059152CB|nr:gamma-glutamyl-gamma-aminobutyrate hydrolase family protein [Ahrensia sp. R2A130]